MKHKKKIKAGMAFAALTVVKEITIDKRYRKFEVLCVCGVRKEVFLGNLTSGNTKSCGCRQSPPIPHKSKMPEYRYWHKLRNFCNNPRSQSWSTNGGKGISYDPSWDDFEVFLKDMGPRPEGAVLIRINILKDYSPKNCKWGYR